MRLAKFCLAATVLQVSTAALAGDLSHSTPQQAFAALGTSRDPAVIYKEAVSQGWTVSRANSGGLNLSGRLPDGTYVFDRLDPAEYWKPNKSPPQANSDNSNIVFRKWENHEHRISVPGTSTDVVTNPDGTLDYNNGGADVTSYWIVDKGTDKGKIAPTTDPRESHMPIDGNPADIEIPNFVLNGSSYDNPPPNPNNLPVPVGKPYGPDNPNGERPFYPPVPTDPNANLPVPVEKPPANSATNQTPPETPPSSGLRQGARNVAEGAIVNAFTTYWTCIQANPDQQSQCAKASGISTVIGAGCTTAQEATGSATVGFACNSLIGYTACVKSGRDPNQCLADWQSGIPAAAFCAGVGLLNVAAGMICGAIAPSSFEAGAAILDAGDAERISAVMGPIANHAMACEFGPALALAMRDLTHPRMGLGTVDEKLVRILEADLLAQRNVERLLGEAQDATESQQRQTLLNQALAAAGSIRCLRERVTALMPPPPPPKVTKVTPLTPPPPPPKKSPTVPPQTPVKTSPVTPIPPKTADGCTTYRCSYVNVGVGVSDATTLHHFDVCISAGDWSRSSSCTDQWWVKSHWKSNINQGADPPDPADPHHPDGTNVASCQMSTDDGVTDYGSFVKYCKSLGYFDPGKATIISPSTTHADVAMVTPPDIAVDSPVKPPPPDVAVDSPKPPTHEQPEPPPSHSASLPNPEPTPGPQPAPAPTVYGGAPSQPQINVYVPPQSGPAPEPHPGPGPRVNGGTPHVEPPPHPAPPPQTAQPSPRPASPPPASPPQPGPRENGGSCDITPTAPECAPPAKTAEPKPNPAPSTPQTPPATKATEPKPNPASQTPAPPKTAEPKPGPATPQPTPPKTPEPKPGLTPPAPPSPTKTAEPKPNPAPSTPEPKVAALPVQPVPAPKAAPTPPAVKPLPVEPAPSTAAKTLPVSPPAPKSLPVQTAPPPKPLPPVAAVPPPKPAQPQPAPPPPPTPAKQSPSEPPPPPPPPLPQREARVEPPPVQPACNKSHVQFDVTQSEAATVEETIVGGASCEDSFVGRGSTQLTGASISSSPSNGTLQQISDLKFRYQPHKGFRGSDGYAVQVCGEGNNGSGCSTITYEVNVE